MAQPWPAIPDLASSQVPVEAVESLVDLLLIVDESSPLVVSVAPNLVLEMTTRAPFSPS
jgi:hypothetical protein